MDIQSLICGTSDIQPMHIANDKNRHSLDDMSFKVANEISDGSELKTPGEKQTKNSSPDLSLVINTSASNNQESKLDQISENNEKKLSQIDVTVSNVIESKLNQISENNGKKLSQIDVTVSDNKCSDKKSPVSVGIPEKLEKSSREESTANAQSRNKTIETSESISAIKYTPRENSSKLGPCQNNSTGNSSFCKKSVRKITDTEFIEKIERRENATPYTKKIKFKKIRKALKFDDQFSNYPVSNFDTSNDKLLWSSSLRKAEKPISINTKDTGQTRLSLIEVDANNSVNISKTLKLPKMPSNQENKNDLSFKRVLKSPLSEEITKFVKSINNLSNNDSFNRSIDSKIDININIVINNSSNKPDFNTSINNQRSTREISTNTDPCDLQNVISSTPADIKLSVGKELNCTQSSKNSIKHQSMNKCHSKTKEDILRIDANHYVIRHPNESTGDGECSDISVTKLSNEDTMNHSPIEMIHDLNSVLGLEEQANVLTDKSCEEELEINSLVDDEEPKSLSKKKYHCPPETCTMKSEKVKPKITTSRNFTQKIAKLTTEQSEKLSNLKVQLQHIPPKQHCISSTPFRRLTNEQKEQFKKYHPLKNGYFSAEEDDILLTNWIRFCEIHNWDPLIVYPFTNIRNHKEEYYIESMVQRKKFFQFLANGLNSRYLHQVFLRFKILCQGKTKGKYTEEEDEIILSHVIEGSEDFKTKTSLGYLKLANILGRTDESIYYHYNRYLRSLNGSIVEEPTRVTKSCKTLRYTLNMAHKLITALLNVLNFQDVVQLKNFTIPKCVWLAVQEKMNIDYLALRKFWDSQLHMQLFCEKDISMIDVEIRLITYMHEKNVTNFEHIDWQDVQSYFDGCTISFLNTSFQELITPLIEDGFEDHAEIIRFLHDEKMPEIAQYEKDLCLPKLVYNRDKGELRCQNAEKKTNFVSDEESDSSFNYSETKQKNLSFCPDAHSTHIERTSRYNTRSSKRYSYVDVYTDTEEEP